MLMEWNMRIWSYRKASQLQMLLADFKDEAYEQNFTCDVGF